MRIKDLLGTVTRVKKKKKKPNYQLLGQFSCEIPELLAPSQDRDGLNAAIVGAIQPAALEWGVKALRYEIRDIQVC